MGSVNTKTMQEFYRRHQEEKPGDSKNWLKLAEGTHTLRIAPPFDDSGLPFRKRVNHNDYTDNNGRNIAPLCMNFVFENAPCATYLAGKKLLSKQDYDLWKKHKCPMCRLAQAVKDIGRTDPTANKLFARTAFLWNVVDRRMRDEQNPGGRLFKWNSANKFFDAIMNQHTVYEDLFDEMKGLDFMMTATGSGMNRRYSAPTFIPTPSALNHSGELFNLDDAVAQGFKSFIGMLESIALTKNVNEFVTITNFDVKKFAVL